MEGRAPPKNDNSISLSKKGDKAVAPGCTVPYHHKSGSGLGGSANICHAAGTSDVSCVRKDTVSDEESTGTHEKRTKDYLHDEGEGRGSALRL